MTDPVAAVHDVYARLAALDDPAVVVAVVDRDRALTRAHALATSADRDALYGVAVLVKDNIAVSGIPTRAGCPAYASEPASMPATIVARLEDAGAIVVGTTNMDQFATGLVGTRSPYGTPRNPCAPAHIPGGSSSGAAVAVARGLVRLAIGTDTAGSGRVPAACTNTVGLKPTRGYVDMRGIVPAVPGIDCVSFHTTTVREAWDAFVAVADDDSAVVTDGAAHGDSRVGRVAATVIAEWCEPAVRDAYERTCAENSATTAVDMEPFFAAGRLLYGPFVAARTAAFGAFITAHPEAVDPYVAEVVGRGHAVTGSEVFAAQAELASLQALTSACFETVDALVVPTIPMLPTLAQVAADPIGVNARLGRFTDFVNLVDCCAVAVPGAARADGLPFGVSVIAPAGADARAASIAADICGEEWQPTPPGGPARLAVVGAHLRGLPLHHQLIDLGARPLACSRTAPVYRLYALPGTTPPKPGLVRDAAGASIECEIYALGHAELGRFVASVAPPLAIGPVELADGSVVPGFLATPGALDRARDITAFGGWRAYLASEMRA